MFSKKKTSSRYKSQKRIERAYRHISVRNHTAINITE